MGTGSALKQAIDSALCAFCYVRPMLFPLLLQRVRILVPNLATDHSASISDDRKERGGHTDDRKSEITAEEWYCRYVLSEYKRLSLTEGQLLTVAAAARSPPGIQQLIDSGLPALLTASITGTLFSKLICIYTRITQLDNEISRTDFCNLERSRRQQQRSRKTSTDDSCQTDFVEDVGLTDSDKAGETCTQSSNHLRMYTPFGDFKFLWI